MSQAKHRGVVVVGSANVDLVVPVDRRPGAGETVLGGELLELAGGKGANQSVAAARLGGNVAIVGATGDDAHAELVRASLRDAGVDVAHLEVVGGAATGVALVVVTADGENSIVVAPGANGRVGDEILTRAKKQLRSAAVLVLQMEIPVSANLLALALVPDDCRVVLNAAPPAHVPPALMRRCDPLVVNEHEAAIVLGERVSSPRAAARELVHRGARSVVVTCGAEGAYVADPDGVGHVAARPVVAVDTTGAGDAFVGALSWKLCEGYSLLAAAEFAVRVATTAVLRPGAQTSYPRLHEVLD